MYDPFTGQHDPLARERRFLRENGWRETFTRSEQWDKVFDGELVSLWTRDAAKYQTRYWFAGLRVFEIVRDDGDAYVGFGYSFGYLATDGQRWWNVSMESGKRWSISGYPHAQADLVAVRSFAETGTYEGDRFHLLYVKEVEL